MSTRTKTILFILPFALYLLISFLWPQLPMPWPDETVFYITGKDFIEKGIWKMGHLAYISSSYDTANFNIPPLYSLMLYYWAKVAQITTQSFFSLPQIVAGLAIPVSAYICASKNKVLSALFVSAYPIIYYNSHVNRPESYIAPLMALLIAILWKYPVQEKISRRILSVLAISAILAFCAYQHYNAIVLIPVLVIMLFSKEHFKTAIKDLLLIAFITAILMTPWVIYLIKNYADFQIQFFDQTKRIYYEISPHGLIYYLGVMLIKPSSAGLRNNDLVFYILTASRGILLASFLALAAFCRKNISARSFKLFISFLAVLIFCAKHNEPWFRIYIDILLIFNVLSLIDDLSKTGFSPKFFVSIFATINIILIAVVILWYPNHYFTGKSYDEAVDCLVEKLPTGSELVINAIPDPSVLILAKRPDLTVYRMNDFPFYPNEWKSLVQKETQFVTARFDIEGFDGINGIRLDHGDAVKNRLLSGKEKGKLTTIRCDAGKVPIYLNKVD